MPWILTSCLCIAAVMMVTGLGLELQRNSEPYYNNDESRQIMTAIYWHDLLRVTPARDPKGFTHAYYAHFPAIAPLHWPPMNHIIAGSLFLLTGPSVPAARLIICGMSIILLAMIFRLTRQRYGLAAATLAAILFVSIPLVKQLSAVFMLDIPVIFWMTAVVVAMAFFIKTAKPSYIWLMCVLMVMAVFTKQHAIVLVPALVAGAVGGFKRHHWRCWHLYAAASLAVAITATYYGLALAAITSSWQDVVVRQGSALDELANFARQMGLVFIAAGILSVATCLLRHRHWLENLCLVWIATVLLVFMMTGVKSSRYLFYMTPAVLILSAGLLGQLIHRVTARPAYAAVLCLTFLAGWNALRPNPATLWGYRDAAQAALRRSPDRPILFGGVYDGPFVLYCRLADDNLHGVVLRADKLAGGGIIMPNRGYTPFVQSYAELAQTIRATGVEIIVLEAQPDIATKEHRWLWEYARRECQEVDQIAALLPSGEATCLRVFHNPVTGPNPQRVSIPMLTLRQGHIQCDLSKSLRQWP